MGGRGLVLGGGARVLAHLGVLQALEEAASLPTPSPAPAWARSSRRLRDGPRRRRDPRPDVGRNPIDEYTLPFHALTRGARVDAGRGKRFGSVRIADPWLPFFRVPSN